MENSDIVFIFTDGFKKTPENNLESCLCFLHKYTLFSAFQYPNPDYFHWFYCSAGKHCFSAASSSHPQGKGRTCSCMLKTSTEQNLMIRKVHITQAIANISVLRILKEVISVVQLCGKFSEIFTCIFESILGTCMSSRWITKSDSQLFCYQCLPLPNPCPLTSLVESHHQFREHKVIPSRLERIQVFKHCRRRSQIS